MALSKSVFIDQSAFLAFIGHPEYSNFHEIINNWFISYFKGEFSKKFDILVTSDYVVLSVIQKLYENKLNDTIIQFVKNLIRSSSIKILNVHEDGFTHACRNIETYYSIFKFDFSFADIATLFLLKSNKIKYLLTCNSSFHRLEYLIRLDFNPDMDGTNNDLFYDAIPDVIFKSEKESPFFIYNHKVRPEDAIVLFEIEITQWTVKEIEVNEEFFVTKMKLGYEFENKSEDKRTDSRIIPDSILKLEKLEILDLSNINLSDHDTAIFQIIESLTNLKQINLKNNKLSTVPKKFSSIMQKNCEILI